MKHKSIYALIGMLVFLLPSIIALVFSMFLATFWTEKMINLITWPGEYFLEKFNYFGFSQQHDWLVYIFSMFFYSVPGLILGYFYGKKANKIISNS